MSSESTFCVIEQIEQWETLKRAVSSTDLARLRLYCICPETSARLRQEGISFAEISDLFLQEKWADINAWAKKTALSWFEDPLVRSLLEIDGINMGDVLSRPIAHLLIHQAKHTLFASQILHENPHGDVLLFENVIGRRPLFARLEFNTFNQLLGCMARERGLGLRTIRTVVAPDRPFSLKAWIKGILGRLESFRCVRATSGCDVVASGALKHLLPVLKGLKGKFRVALFGVQGFQKQDRDVCRKEGFAYVLPEMVLDFQDRQRLAVLREGLPQRLAALKTALGKKSFFEYDALRLPLIEEIILAKIGDLIPIKCELMLASRAIAQRWKARLTLLDEDVDWRRVLAMTFRQAGVSTFVLSHGIPNSTSDLSGILSNAGVAETIVNSQFEKEKYIEAGWDPRLLHVLGLPRYDGIWELTRANGRSPRATRCLTSQKTVLYCPHMLTRRRKRKEGFLGIHTPGNETKENTVAVIEACQTAGCKLIIKPHSDAGDIDLWEDLVREHSGPDVTLTSHAADIFELIAQADILVATFSTAILEAALFGKRAISINFTGKPDVHPFTQKGIAVGVRRKEDLVHVLASDLPVPPLEVIEYFCGRNDGRATHRVIRFLEERLENERRDHDYGYHSSPDGVFAASR